MKQAKISEQLLGMHGGQSLHVRTFKKSRYKITVKAQSDIEDVTADLIDRLHPPRLRANKSKAGRSSFWFGKRKRRPLIAR